ncbi:radical SAM/SPASM domain-containing protein [Haliovirga abyssi]|uniref:Radical SAM/SPASM domain Clo7bot peptide maturase n=1 Tax=Haliovirga abyssi TaxID=2996794 RepID=A0AAU9DV55_9FUSO|nr:radical SAM protein [Haliovirga abyssi]BDU51204.1 radical SAM/SPASM domain Clo7bot peptide maturase [Haliovirga abyssi]
MEKLQYKESRYNYKIKLDNERLAVYNCKTRAIFIPKENQEDIIIKLLKKPNNIKLEEEKIKDVLIKYGYLIENNRDEILEVSRKFDYGNSLNLVLFPTEECNFRCPYCFIYKYKNVTMKEEVYRSIYNFIENKLKASNRDKNFYVNIHWFGGEPMLEYKNILNFMEKIKKLEEKYSHLKLTSNMTTNGYLLTYDKFEKLVNKGIKKFQITFDGDKESHDKLRNLRNGEGTFDKIYENLLLISKKVEKEFNIDIRVNFLKKNLKSSKVLIEKFEKEFMDDMRFFIYFAPVYEVETKRSSNERIKEEIYGTKEAMKIKHKINNEIYYKRMRYRIEKNNFKKEEIKYIISNLLPMPKNVGCYAYKENSYVISSEGLVYPCESSVGQEENNIGYITEDGEMNITNKKREKEWRQLVVKNKEQLECLDCKELPICHGGCKKKILDKKISCEIDGESVKDAVTKYSKLYFEYL